MKNKLWVLTVLIISLVLNACSVVAPISAPAAAPEAVTVKVESAPPANEIPEISIDAADFSYAAPDAVGAGWVRVSLTNSGVEPHHVQFLRLNDGVTVEQFQEALQQGEGPALALVKQMGGVGAVAPTGSAQAILNLAAGEYVILCLIPSPGDHVPHLAKGMIKTLKVEAVDSTAVYEPQNPLTVRMKDFIFDIPQELPAGKTVIEVVNEGPEPHELNFLRLADGKTLSDVMQYLSAPDGPPPFTPVGGMNGLDVGVTGYVEFDFQPGKYVAICNIPSPKAEGHPHFTLGMIKEFSVVAGFPTGRFMSAENKALGYVFNADHTWEYREYGTTGAAGTYRIEGNLWIEEGTEECPFPGTYEWSYDGANLTFNLVGEDACTPRQAATDGQTFVLTK